jgi:hypothetical protein
MCNAQCAMESDFHMRRYGTGSVSDLNIDHVVS